MKKKKAGRERGGRGGVRGEEEERERGREGRSERMGCGNDRARQDIQLPFPMM